MHRWVFTPASLLFILRDLASHGLLDFDVEAVERGVGPNIFLVLRKVDTPKLLDMTQRFHLHAAMAMDQEVHTAQIKLSAGFNEFPVSDEVETLTRKLMASSRSDLEFLLNRSS